MEIIKKNENGSLLIEIKGRIDTFNAAKLEAALEGSTGKEENLIFDFKNVEYISAAGLRVLIEAQKKTGDHGGMIIKNVSKDVMDVFFITGLADTFTIE